MENYYEDTNLVILKYFLLLEYKKINLNMKKNILLGIFVCMLFLISCNRENKIVTSLREYNISMQNEGFRFGDKINLPSDVMNYSDNISISFGDFTSDSLVINPKYFILGKNSINFLIQMKNKKIINYDMDINVFAKNKEKTLSYKQIAEYPHDTKNFVQGFQLEGNTIYESIGQYGESKLIKYTLGSISPINKVLQPNEIFSEGSCIVDDKIYQLTWHEKKGFIYDKKTLKLLGEFSYPREILEGWGLAYDGKNLILSDGSANIYFLDIKDTTKIVKKIGVAGFDSFYEQINELEYHQGFIYANIWQNPIILKIDPSTGEVVGKYDFSDYAKLHTKGEDDVLNGIAFKGKNMLITGKYWPKIYELNIN